MPESITNSFNNNYNSPITIINNVQKIPNQLSLKLSKSTCIGRKKELIEIEDKLLISDNTLLIKGIGGIGKSTIASTYINKHKNNFDYYGFFEGIESFLTELRINLDIKSEKEQDAFIEILFKLGNLEGKKLLVLDDIKDIDNNQEKIKSILELKHKGYSILLTSREEIEKVKIYPLNILTPNDAKALFNSIYKVDDTKLLEEILEYLDYHAFFIEKTAQSIKKTVSPQIIKEKFLSGEFSAISVKRKQNFNKLLNQLFNLDALDNEEILMLKQLSTLPSIEISLEFLEDIFQKKGDLEFEELLDYLCEKGWLSKFESGYKLHQITKEYFLGNHTLTFEEMKSIFSYFFKLIENSADMNIAILHKDKLIFFESLSNVIKKYENFEVTIFYMNLGNIYRTLSTYKKALFYIRLSLKRIHVLENNIDSTNLEILLIWKASIYNNLSQTYYYLANYKKTLVLDKKALVLREQILGKNHIHTIQSYNNLAQLYFSCGNIDNAKKLFIKSIYNITKVNVNEKNSEITILSEKSTLYSNYGSFLIKIEYKNKNRVLKYLKKAVDLYIQYKDYSNPAFITCKFNLAKGYEYCGEYDRAEELYIDVLESKISTFGKCHNDVATAYMGISLFYSEYKKDCKLSIEYTNKAIDIYKTVYLTDLHPDIALAYDNLGTIYNKCRDYKQANTFTLKALELHEKLLGESHYSTVMNYYNVGVSYYMLENFKEARNYLLKAIYYNKSFLENDTVKKMLIDIKKRQQT